MMSLVKLRRNALIDEIHGVTTHQQRYVVVYEGSEIEVR